MLSQVDIAAACGDEPTFICREVLERTNSEWLAEVADVLFAKPLTILLIVVVAAVVNRLLRRAVARFMASVAGNQQPGRRLKRSLRGSRVGRVLPAGVLDTGAMSLRAAARAETLGLVLRSISSVVIWTIAAVTILGELGINLGPLVAGAGVVGVAFGFGAQSLVRDFLAGFFILIEDQYGVGDIVDAGEAIGTIEAVSLRTTRLRDVQGTVWHVPNGQIVRVGNMSQQWARALLDVSVAYGSDLAHAEGVIKQVADEMWRDDAWRGQILEEPEMWGVEALAADAVTLRLVVKTQPSRQFAVMRELRARIKVALDEAGVEIPFTQRTIWVRRDPGSSAEADSGDDADLELDSDPAPPRTATKKAPPARSAAKKRTPRTK